MFDQEIVNSFAGGYKIEIPAVVTLIGSPIISSEGSSISFPISIKRNILTRKNETIEWRDREEFFSQYVPQSTDGTWSDPIKIMASISKQRGWPYGIKTIVNDEINFNSGTGYLNSLINSVILSFALANDIRLPNSEILELNMEIQERIKGERDYAEPLAQLEGKSNSLLFSDGNEKKFRNEIINLEPYSMYLIEENSLDSNTNIEKFKKNKRKFFSERMYKKNSNILNYPFNAYFAHYEKESYYYNEMLKAAEKNDVTTFLTAMSQHSQSVRFNLDVVSNFQKIISDLLLKNGAEYFSFNISEYSGSVILFSDNPQVTKIRDNIIREYYSITNKTITIREVTINGPISYSRVIV